MEEDENTQQSYLTDNCFTCIEASKAKKQEAEKWQDLWGKGKHQW